MGLIIGLYIAGVEGVSCCYCFLRLDFNELYVLAGVLSVFDDDDVDWEADYICSRRWLKA